MPLPSKQNKEGKSQFMSRCLSDSIMKKEFPDMKQRIAVCLSKFKDKKVEKKK